MKKTIVAMLVTIPLVLSGAPAFADKVAKDPAVKAACVSAKATLATAKAAQSSSKSATTKSARKAAAAAVVAACPGK